MHPEDGRIPKGAKLRSIVEHLSTERPTPAEAVITLADA